MKSEFWLMMKKITCPEVIFFVGFLVKIQVKNLLDDGDVTTSKRQYDMRFNACLIFHKTVFLYGLENFPVNNGLFKHARAFNFRNQKWSFESACSVSYCEELKSYVTLKLVSAIFYLIFIFHQMRAFQKI